MSQDFKDFCALVFALAGLYSAVILAAALGDKL